MQSPPLRRGAPAQSAETFAFETRLDDEVAVLDAILAALARAELPVGTWDRLLSAAQRDGRLSELAFAFESSSRGKRVKSLTPALSADFLFQAARFFGDVLRDELGAVEYLERALGLAPTHAPSFDKIEQILRKFQQPKKLADIFATVAQHRPRSEQPQLLRRAAELLMQAGGVDEKVIDLLQQVLRLEPGEEQARLELEALYVKGNRFRDAVRLNEQALAADPPPDEATRKTLLTHVVDVYADKLHEPERAMPHVEQLLAMDPANELGRKVAQKLVVVKGLAGRAAAALANACEVVGTPQEVARFVTIELENTRGPRRATLLARLGALKAERMGDERGAFEALEQALAIDAADDDLRARYVALARKLGRHVDAAKTLGRVLSTVKSPVVKARVGVQLAETFLRAGDVKRAKAALAGVLAAADAPDDARLAGARALAEIHEAASDHRALCEALEKVASLEPDDAKREAVDSTLAELAMALGDRARAIAAYERLLSTSSRARALEALAPLYESGGDPEKLALLLEEQAKDTPDPTEARGRMMRAADVRAHATTNVEAAIASCQAVVERFGPSRDVLSLLIPLLETRRLWPELERALAYDAALAEGTEHTHAIVRLGTLRLQRLGDAAGAIGAFGDALSIDPNDRTARLMLEKIMAAGEHRLPAARVLEPLYRHQAASGLLFKVLELRGALEPDVDERLAAMREAVQLADGAEAGRSADVIGHALGDAVANGRPLGEWLERLAAAAGIAHDAKRRAAILATALGDRDVTTEDLSSLAKRAAEAHAAAGDVQAAIAHYRRALSFEPHSVDLLSRIDDLLRGQGSPEERILLYRAALERGGASRRKDLLHRIGAIEWHDLGDLSAAIGTYRAALDDDALDEDAHAALAGLYAKAERWDDLSALLEVRLARTGAQGARATRAALAEVAAVHGDRGSAKEHCERLLTDPDLAREELDAVARAARALEDADLERAVILRRADAAQDPRERVGWLDQLGEIDSERRKDPSAAADAWRRAAQLAEAAGDEEDARRLYGRALAMAPEDRDLAARLAFLCERAQLWQDLPPLYEALTRQAADDDERVDLCLRAARLLSEKLGDPVGAASAAGRAFSLAHSRADVLAIFEGLSIAAGTGRAFGDAIAAALEPSEPTLGRSGELKARLRSARARALASDPKLAEDAVSAYRAILEDESAEPTSLSEALAALERLAPAGAESPARRSDRRWLLEWRANHGAEEDRVVRLLDWAREEETTLGDPATALSLYRRVLEVDGDCDEALSATIRLSLATGDADAALSALVARRDRAQGPPRVAIELQIARVALSQSRRWKDGIAALGAVLSEVPNDPTARALAAQLLEEPAARADATRTLEQAYEATDDAGTRIDILERLLDAPADVNAAEARRGWLERLCDLQRDLGSPETAWATAMRAASEMPDVAALWDRAEGLARALSRPDDMAALYDRVLARPLTSSEVQPIGERAVQFQEEWFEDPARVVRTLERVLELDPNADWAFDRLKLLLDAAERWDDLFALFDRALRSATGRRRSALLEDAAQTAKDFADEPDRAIDYLEQLYALTPDDAKLSSALERLYERQGRHRQLVALLTTRLATIEPGEVERARSRIATLWLDGLGDASAAFETLEPILGGSLEGVDGSTSPTVWPLLERILAAAPPTPDAYASSAPPPRASERPSRTKRGRRSEPPSSSPASVRQRAAGHLRAHYERVGQVADLVRMLVVELEAVKLPKERVRRHLQIAACYEKLGDGASALEQVGSAVRLDPHDEAKRAELAALAERTARLERFAELLTAAADTSEDQSLRVALAMQAAAIRADRIGDAPGAIALLSAVMETPRLRDEDVLEAGRRLEPLLEAASRDEERLDVLERMAGIEPNPDPRRALLGRAALLADKLGQNERAIALWERCIGQAAADLEALDGLVGLLERLGRDDRLVDVLHLRSRAASSDDLRRTDRTRAAALLGSVLGRPTDAIHAWREIERDFGPSDDTAEALAALLRSTGSWAELTVMLDREAARTDDLPTRAEFLRQLGDVQRAELAALPSAVETYARALSADPVNPGSRSGLLALADDGGLRVRAVSVLLAAMRATADWRSVLELTDHRLRAATSDAEKIAVLCESSEIAEQRAADAGMAFEAILSAFAIAPGDEVVEREAARLAEAAGGWRRLVDAYREAIDGPGRDNRALTARLRANCGAVLETRLGDLRGALAAYQDVARETLDVAAGCAALRVAGQLAEWEVGARVVVDVARLRGATSSELLDAYGQAADTGAAWDDAVLSLATQTSTANLPSRAARDLEARMAVWHRDRRGDSDAAQLALERALAHDDSDTSLLVMLVELQRRRPGPALVDSLLRFSRRHGGDLALCREAVEVARDFVQDATLARSISTELLALARSRWKDASVPDAAGYAQWAIESLARLHEDAGDARAMVEVLVEGDGLPFDLGVRRGMRRRAARAALDRLGDHELAIALYLALFDEDPHDEEAAERLSATYALHGRKRELLALRERQIAAADDVTTRVGLRMDAVRLLGDLGDDAAAIDALRTNLKDDRRHAETVEALADRLDARGAIAELRDLLREQAELAEAARETARAADLWFRAAVLAEERMGDPASAETYHGRVAMLEPRAGCLDALGRLALARGDHAAAVEWMERLLRVAEGEQQIGATLRLARALVGTGASTRATERLAQALALRPEAEPLREQLAALYREQGAFERLAVVTSEGAAHAPNKATRMARLREGARLFSEFCGKPELAVPMLEQARDLAPEDQSAALALAEALAASQRFDDARAMLRSMVDAFGGRRPRERAPVHHQIARIELATGNRAGALVELDAAARAAPQNPDILRSLAELARDDGQLDRAEKSYRALLLVLRRSEDGRALPRIARTEVLVELSAIAERQGEHDRSREILESAIEAAANGEFEQERLESALRARADHATLVRVLEAKVARVGKGPAAAKALAEMADVFADELGQPDQGLSARLRAIAMVPLSDEAHDAALTLARAAARVGQYMAAASALVDEAVARGDVSLACSMLVRMGGAAERDLCDDSRAAALYERAVDLGLQTSEVLRALDQVYDRLGEVQKQARILSLRVAVDGRSGPSGARDAVYRLATLRLSSRATVDDGVEMLRAALLVDPALDRAEEALRRAVAVDPTHLGVLELYEHVGRQPGHERALVDALRLRADLVGADVEPLREAVEVAVRIGDTALAESLLDRVVHGAAAQPQSPAALAWAMDVLANLRQAAGDLRKALELKLSAARIADPAVGRKLTFEAARIAADPLGDWPLAAEVYEGLYRADPSDREAWEPLLLAYRRSGDTLKVADLLAALVDHVEEGSLRARLRLERVRVMRELGMTDADAAPILREIIDEDSSQVDAAIMLAGILERAGLTRELTNLFERQIDSAKDRADSASVVSLTLRLGALLEPSQRGQARDAYYAALEWEPSNVDLLDALARLLVGQDDAAERADILERRLAVERGPAAEPMALELWTARVRLGDQAGAERALELGFRAYPASAALRDDLESVLRDRRQWTKLADFYALDASARPDPGERVARLREAAAIWRTELGDPRSAATTIGLARAAARSLDTGAADVRGALLRDHVDALLESGDSATALSELSAEIDALGSDSRRADLLGARANLRTATGDGAGGLADLEAAFAIEPTQYAAPLGEQLQNARSAAEASGDAAAVRAIRLRYAEVIPHAGNADGARAVFDQLLSEDPQDRDALRGLASLEWNLEQWGAASVALKRLVGLDRSPDTLQTALRLAEACERAGRPEDARGALERALAVAPEDVAARARLRQIYEQLGAWRELADLLLADASAAGDVADRFRLLLAAGSLLLERAGDPGAGLEALEKARALRPLDPECAALLSDAYTTAGRTQEAAALLEPLIAPHKGRRARELAPLHWQQSRLARYHGNRAEELRSLTQALDCDGQSGSVCARVALRAMEIDQLELASRALRALTLLKTPGPMSRALAYQHLGEIAYRQGDTKRAVALLQRAVSADPSLDGARELAESIGRSAPP